MLTLSEGASFFKRRQATFHHVALSLLYEERLSACYILGQLQVTYFSSSNVLLQSDKVRSFKLL